MSGFTWALPRVPFPFAVLLCMLLLIFKKKKNKKTLRHEEISEGVHGQAYEQAKKKGRIKNRKSHIIVKL